MVTRGAIHAHFLWSGVLQSSDWADVWFLVCRQSARCAFVRTDHPAVQASTGMAQPCSCVGILVRGSHGCTGYDPSPLSSLPVGEGNSDWMLPVGSLVAADLLHSVGISADA